MLVMQLCLTLWDPMDSSLPGSSIHGILQARILERVATSFSRGSSPPRDWTWVSIALQADSLPSEPPGKHLLLHYVTTGEYYVYGSPWMKEVYQAWKLCILFSLLINIFSKLYPLSITFHTNILPKTAKLESLWKTQIGKLRLTVIRLSP